VKRRAAACPGDSSPDAGAVERAGGVPGYRETQNYVQKITDRYFHSEARDKNWVPQPRTIRREVDERGKVVFTNE
jgi:hypothetical protein